MNWDRYIWKIISDLRFLKTLDFSLPIFLGMGTQVMPRFKYINLSNQNIGMIIFPLKDQSLYWLIGCLSNKQISHWILLRDQLKRLWVVASLPLISSMRFNYALLGSLLEIDPEITCFLLSGFTRVRCDQKWSIAAVSGLELHNPYFPALIVLLSCFILTRVRLNQKWSLAVPPGLEPLNLHFSAWIAQIVCFVLLEITCLPSCSFFLGDAMSIRFQVLVTSC